MSDRIAEELSLLREEYPDLEHRLDAEVHWVRIPSYPISEGWSAPEVEVAFQIPSAPGQAPYAFRVRPGLRLADGPEPANYTFPVETPWGGDWGQFSWSPASWVPNEEVRLGANMLAFVRSFDDRLREG